MPSDITKEKINQDLKTIRKWGWSRTDKLEGLNLLKVPQVARAAKKPGGTSEKVDVVQRYLRQVLGAIRRREKANRPYNSVADAGGAILHLEVPYEEMEIEKVREKLFKDKVWKRKDEKGIVKVGSFRENTEPDLLDDFADEILELLRRKKGGATGNGSIEELVRDELREMETAMSNRRLRSVDSEGQLEIRDEDEMLEVLLIITRLGAEKFCAVDNTPPGQWFEDRLGKYLDKQLARVKKSKGSIGLERIYLVSEKHREKNPKAYVEAIRKLDERHRKASATLLLCPLDAAMGLKLSFVEHRGLFLAEGSRGAVAVTGKLGVGAVGSARVYSRGNGVDVKTLSNEYLLLYQDIKHNDRDAKMRKELGLG